MRAGLAILPLLAACATSVVDDSPREDPPRNEPDASVRLPPESPPPVRDGAAPDAEASIDAGCKSTAAIVAGGASGIFAATWSSAGWSAPQPLAGGTSSAPAVAWDGAAWLAALRSTDDAMLSTRKSGASWSSLAPIGSATTQGAPALVTLGTTTHLVYWGSNGKFYHGAFSAGAWDSASDPVGGASRQSFGLCAPTATSQGGSFTIVQSSTDSNVYAQDWSAGWAPASPLSAAFDAKTTASPRIVTLSGGDTLVVFSHSDDLLLFSRRRGSSWEPATALHVDLGGASAISPGPVALVALPNDAAELVFVGGDGKPYASLYPGVAPWSPPAQLAVPALASTPSIATGVCGDDAILAYATSDGSVATMTLHAGTWSAPSPISGISGASFVTIATRP